MAGIVPERHENEFKPFVCNNLIAVQQHWTREAPAGVGVGYENRDLFTVTSGTKTTYTGIVGSIDESRFAENQYRFGLFTYVYDDPMSGQSFQVLNYWVE